MKTRKKTRKYTQKEILECFIEIHGERYDYSKFIYINSKTHSVIICRIHGEFLQTPHGHLHGNDCKKCTDEEIRRITRIKMFKSFIIKSNIIYNNKYDYSKVNYINNTTKITIICPVHGDFIQTPCEHLNGNGCNCIRENKKLTTEKFIEKSKLVHGCKYDYSNIDYKISTEKVLIICKRHGEFWQEPASHLRGCECPGCAWNILTTQEFIIKSNEVHNFRYDYSKCEYINSRENIIITCRIHGDFSQRPSSHLGGSNCIMCAFEGVGTKTTEEFINDAKKIHGEKYDYSIVEYIHCNEKVKIICYEHGIFEQNPTSHLQKCGCPTCGKESSIEKQTMKLEEFIERASKVHNNKYYYNLIENISGGDTKVDVVCIEHGIFNPTVSNHLNETGCPGCNKGVRFTKEEFIKTANEIHNFKYNYSKVEYINNYTKVTIICNDHGEFEQIPSSHSHSKSGCPKCKSSKGETAIHRFLNKNNIFYTIQKTFDDCRSPKQNHRLPFDVYLPEHNLCIEYDGELHYKSSEYFGGDKSLKARQENDRIKNEYCKNNNIPLLRIPYTEFKNIETILTSYLATVS